MYVYMYFDIHINIIGCLSSGCGSGQQNPTRSRAPTSTIAKKLNSSPDNDDDERTTAADPI